MDRVYDDSGKMEGEEIQLIPGTGRPTADVVYSYPGGGGAPRTTLEAHDDGEVLLVLGPGASAASTADGVTYPDVAMVELPQIITSARRPATRSNVPYAYADWSWTRTTAHGAHLRSGAPSQSAVGAYPDVVMAMEQSGAAPLPAPAATRSSVPSTAAITGESYTDMLMAHLGSSDDKSPAAWNIVPYPAGSSATAPPSAAISGVATAYPGGLNLNAGVTAGPNTNVVGFGYAIGVADLGSERLHPTGTAAAAAVANELGGGGYYYSNPGMNFPFAAQDEVGGAVAEPVRGGHGGLGLAATSVAMAGLIAGGVDTPVTAIVLFGMLIAGVIMVTGRVSRG